MKETVQATLTKRGNALVGAILRPRKPKDVGPKEVPQQEWDAALVDHVAKMADEATVDVEVTFDILNNGKRTVRLAGVAELASVESDPERVAAVRGGGFVNPYTFVPTPPREGLEGTGLADNSPPSHAYHGEGQWTGTLPLTLTTVTPLLLPVRTAEQPTDGSTDFDVRVGPDGRPLIHGASFKGALRSAYETITASRYGVFFDHEERLAYRATAGAALGLTPARVYRNGDAPYFRLCRADDSWATTNEPRNEVQHAAWVPAYKSQSLVRLGGLEADPLTRHHEKQVYARVVLYQYQKGNTRFQAWRATHLAPTARQIEDYLSTGRVEDPVRAGRLTLRDGVSPRIVRGWLSATGYSIKSKHDERLFVETEGQDLPLEYEHLTYWRSVLRAYDLAYEYNDPMATYSRGPAKERKVERSHHVPSSRELRDLPDGTLVYVKYDKNRITEVHPVMIGRLPFDAAPGDLLPECLRPTNDRDKLSPADRLFGWVPAGDRDNGDRVNDGASGYRGRLVVRSISCATDDWKPENFPCNGVTLAPLSSPKPTQFRFYASADPGGMPMRRAEGKNNGYAAGGGLRGRKMYRWRQEEPDHWQPTKDQEDPQRGYLALEAHRGKPTQLVRHRGWVRPGVTFHVELFLDGVPEAELGALLWLLTQENTARLRIGAGKPYGFGVVITTTDLAGARLWDADGVRAGWLDLHRPAPVDANRLTKLVNQFDSTARANSVLREATESYLKAAAKVTEPVHYPRPTAEPVAESYDWFVANEKPSGGRITHGYSLPHVRESDQRLPYLDCAGEATAQGSRGRPQYDVPEQGRRSRPGWNAGRSGPTGKSGGRGQGSR